MILIFVRGLLAVVAACLFGFAGCGGSSHHARVHAASVPPPVVQTSSCPAGDSRGFAGLCGPRGEYIPKTGLFRLAPEVGPRYPDLSNNDPCVCGSRLKAQGYKGLIVKANQGVGFIDSWAVPMVRSARAAGLAVGAYDFDQDYTVAEAATFVARLHAMGIFPGSKHTFPAYLDVEFGNFSYSGLLRQIAYLRAQGYRVGIYTGEWYWGPHAGCQWPSGVSAWISGYPFAPAVCGLPASLYNSHQYTDTPFDISVFRGPMTFDRFTNAGEDPAVTKVRKQREAFYRSYRILKCRYPQQTSECRWFGNAVKKDQDILWKTYPRWPVFGPHARTKTTIAQIVRPEVAYWSHARDASRRAFDAAVCGGATGTQGLTPRCRVLRQRINWFGSHASAEVKAFS